jgi:hypothetical protein
MWFRTIWYILTLRCEEADRLRAVSEPDRIARHQRIAERIHRALCGSCRHAARQLDRIDRTLRDMRPGCDEQAEHAEWDRARADRLDEALRREMDAN